MGQMGLLLTAQFDQFTELFLTGKLVTQVTTVSLGLCFVFTFLRAENAVSHA